MNLVIICMEIECLFLRRLSASRWTRTLLLRTASPWASTTFNFLALVRSRELGFDGLDTLFDEGLDREDTPGNSSVESGVIA
ncbi:MAG: hypothetical protein ACI9AF_001923, partial [Granulosicoccus sp.]